MNRHPRHPLQILGAADALGQSVPVGSSTPVEVRRVFGALVRGGLAEVVGGKSRVVVSYEGGVYSFHLTQTDNGFVVGVTGPKVTVVRYLDTTGKVVTTPVYMERAVANQVALDAVNRLGEYDGLGEAYDTPADEMGCPCQLRLTQRGRDLLGEAEASSVIDKVFDVINRGIDSATKAASIRSSSSSSTSSSSSDDKRKQARLDARKVLLWAVDRDVFDLAAVIAANLIPKDRAGAAIARLVRRNLVDAVDGGYRASDAGRRLAEKEEAKWRASFGGAPNPTKGWRKFRTTGNRILYQKSNEDRVAVVKRAGDGSTYIVTLFDRGPHGSTSAGALVNRQFHEALREGAAFVRTGDYNATGFGGQSPAAYARHHAKQAAKVMAQLERLRVRAAAARTPARREKLRYLIDKEEARLWMHEHKAGLFPPEPMIDREMREAAAERDLADFYKNPRDDWFGAEGAAT